MTTKLSEINYGDYIVQIHYSPNVKVKPYLIRIYSYHDEPHEIRVEKEELNTLSQLIDRAIGENL